MNISFDLFHLFPEPVASFQLNLNSDEIINFLNKQKFYKNKEEMSQSNVSKNFNILNYLPELKKQIIPCVNYYIKNVLNYNVDFKFEKSWATKTNKKGFSQKHIHNHSLISGVYYPKGSNEFKINFFKKNINSFWNITPKEYTIINSKKWSFKVKENVLILFLSDLEHSIDINNSNLTRYSIAFNVNPVGEIGEGDSKIIL